TAREALASGPVLVQVPRSGYLPGLGCAACRAPARCVHCGGPLGQAGPDAPASCGWCADLAGDWSCPFCGAGLLRASVVGARRTAEELGRAFPGVPVRTSGATVVRDTVPAVPSVVVATPGAEPVVSGGYAAVLLLDGWALLGRADLRAGEEALRRWLNAAALARAGAPLVVGAEADVAAVGALVRWDPVGYAEREAVERAGLHFPPAARLASIEGEPPAVAAFLAELRLPEPAELLGPVPTGQGGERYLARVPRAQGAALARAVKEALGVRSARKLGGVLAVRVDPVEIG
ncbi:MAG: primosome assembly protein PriA, partial [Mycobacteriales bacterium]